MTNAKYEAWIDGEALGAISPDLYICAITYTPAAVTINVNEIVGRWGELEETTRWKGASVTVSFYLRKSTGQERQAILEQVGRWARGKYLEISDRLGERLRVICSAPPYVPDHLSWTDAISVTFRTLAQPFWERQTPAILTLSGETGSGNLFVPGNIGKALVEVDAAPASGTLANITLTVGDTSITLNGVNATSTDHLKITYDERGIQSIKRGTTSVMSARTAASSDDLLAECGKISSISFSASTSASVTFSARGLSV